MQTFLHSPFEEKSCDSCHAPAKDGKVVLVKEGKELCATCHDEVPKEIASAKVQHPGAQGDCTDCHSPHAGKTPRFLRPDPVTACLGCHSDQEAEVKKAHPHQPASEQGCATCHEAHGGANAKLLRAKSVNEECLECHGSDVTPVKAADGATVTIFDGKVQLPSDYFRKVPGLPIKAGLGHPTENHPVQDLMDPANPEKVKTPLNCLSCHQSHGSAKAALLVKDQSDNIDFCKTCHINGLDLKVTKVSK
jgi:predicted CXXCH cytochrome family protein